jgi:2-polyprenyl-6-methoxyphenol hydroxylase-like FAD-dependent oxidoreductase
MRVLIAGAGIGGLSAALCLHSHGIETTVIESATELRPLGLGINLLPRAVGVLTRLGLGEQLARIAIATAANVYCDQRGGLLFTEPRGLAGGYRWPQYSVHRGRLQMLLLDAVRTRLGPDAVRTGTRVRGFTQDTDRVHVQTTGGRLSADALVGADGLHSTVRATLHPGPDPLLWSGVRMWRGVGTVEPFLGGRTMVIASDSSGTELVVYPIGARLTNWVAMISGGAPGPLPGTANWNTPGRAEQILEHVGHWHLGWLDVPGLISTSQEIFEYPMVDREPLAHWGAGRVTLLGDAAHPMYPVGANGGSQAILDAHALAVELARDFPAGLLAYQRTRRDATAAIIKANRDMHHGGAPGSAQLARVTRAYRRATSADAALPEADTAPPGQVS